MKKRGRFRPQLLHMDDHKPDYIPPPERPADIPPRKRSRSLHFSVVDGSFYASMVGFGETYFVPLLIFIGGTNAHVGLFTALPQLGIALAQMMSIYLVERLRARKGIVVSGASMQGFVLAAMLALVLTGSLTPWTLIALAALYFTSNGLALPAWNSLLGDLTTPENRGRYFGRRNGLQQFITFVSIVCGGLILQRSHQWDAEKTGFAVIIALAFVSRFGSVYALTRHFEVPYKRVENAYFSLWQFLKHGPRSNFARFVFFVALMSLAVQIAAPYFVVYMLRDLHFSYLQYTAAQGVFVVTQFLAMRRWGPFADRYGNRLVLYITGILMPVLPLMWFLSDDFIYIIAIQTFAGMAWAGWALATANFIFDAVTPPKRARCAAYLNFFNSLGICVGALIGAWLSSRAPQSLDTGAMKIIFHSNLEYLFLLSGVIRFAIVLVFMPGIHEVRDVTKPEMKDMFMTLVNVKPFAGVRFEPYTGVDQNHEKKEPPDAGAP